MQDDFLDFFLDLFFKVLKYLMVAEHWTVVAQNACDACDRFMVTTTHHAIMTIVLPWIFSTTVRVASILSSVCRGAVHRVCEAACCLCALIKVALVVALWIAYAHVVVVYLLIENMATLIIRSLWALVAAALRFATVVLVHFTAVSLATYFLVCATDLFSTVSATLWSLTIVTYHITTGFVIFPYIAWTTAAWAIRVLMRICKTVYVVGRDLVMTSATSIRARATDLLELLNAAVCSLVEFLPRFSSYVVAAVDLTITAFLAVVSQTFVFLHAIRVVYWDRAFHSADQSATWSFLCVLLVPRLVKNKCGWSAVRLGVHLQTATKTTPTPTVAAEENGRQEQHEDREDRDVRATSELLAPGTGPRSKTTRAWTLRLESRMVWICEVFPVARPMGTLSWARYSAHSPVPVDSGTTSSTSIVTRLPSFGPDRPPFLNVAVPAIVASFLKAARDAFLRDERRLMPAAEAIMAVTEDEHDDEAQIKEAQDEAEVNGEAALVVDENLALLPQQLFLPALELHAVDINEPKHELDDQADLDAFQRAAVDVEAEVDEQPGQDHSDDEEDKEDDGDNARVEPQPLAFAQVEAPLEPEPLQPPLLRRIPPPRVAVRLPLLRNVVVRPEGPASVDRADHTVRVERDETRAGLAAARADGAADGDDLEAVDGEAAPANLIVNHDLNYDRDADSRYRKYRQTPAYQTRREESLAIRRKRGNVRPSPRG